MRLVLDASVAVKWYALEDYTRESYDALYVAYAEREDLKVITADARMINAFEPLGSSVHVKDFRF